ncbi:TonB family protein [Candidatus Avelusimicrobium aviculae]|uniref:TonB family protein n=1 Tax=Candidatus Avelusimicrobium aviculae TaxID=3416206 RepID=UPI003D0D3E3F
MNRYLAYSGGVHALLFLLLFLVMLPAGKQISATYTIDFIGSGKVVATTGQEAQSPVKTQAPKAPEVKAQPVAKPEAEPKPAAKPAKKAYTAKSEITTKKQTAKKQAQAPLAAPSVLDEGENTQKDDALQASKEGEFQGGNIQTDFANFPYPWYITQVRNAMWIEWEKRRPAGNVLSALVSFSIVRDGKLKDVEVQRSSGDDTFDFAATSAVINAGPFAPLPMYYEKDELTVVVEFKQEK